MTMLQKRDLSRLLSAQPGPCVSVYIPIRGRRGDVQGLRAKWNHLLREADERIYRNFSETRARFLTEPMRRNSDFASLVPRHAEGLAFFRSFTTTGYFPVEEEISEFVAVADTFHLRPLLKAIQGQERYFVLALSQRRISLYQGGRKRLVSLASFEADYGSPEPVPIPGKVGIEVPRGKRARDTVVHFRPLHRVSRFVELAEPHIWKRLRAESAPLILVGTPFMHRLYQSVNCYPFLSETGVPASLAHDPRLLHQRTWPLAETLFSRREQALCERFLEEREKGRGSEELSTVAAACVQGRVAYLLLSAGAHLFGVLDRETGAVALRDPASGSLGDDVLDDMAQEVILRKGQVFVVPEATMPTSSPVAATFRW